MRSERIELVVGTALVALCGQPVHADERFGADQGKLLLTAGFSDVEGSGGGGLVPWALITGYGSSDSWGANAHVTSIRLPDFQLYAYGAAIGALDRFELSYTRHELDVSGSALDGLGASQDIYGLKARLFGDAIYTQDSWMPQIAAGIQYKSHGGIDDAAGVGSPGLVNPTQLGAKDDDGTDYYLSAAKVFLAQSFLVNATLRYTEANQFGLLGFGGDEHSDHSFEVEGTVGVLIARNLAVGAEYRGKPDNLSADSEDDAWDAFVAWTPTKNISLVGAYLNLGSILGPVTGETGDQDGVYLSCQVGF